MITINNRHRIYEYSDYKWDFDDKLNNNKTIHLEIEEYSKKKIYFYLQRNTNTKIQKIEKNIHISLFNQSHDQQKTTS